jgi:hypothetical protein
MAWNGSFAKVHTSSRKWKGEQSQFEIKAVVVDYFRIEVVQHNNQKV